MALTNNDIEIIERIIVASTSEHFGNMDKTLVYIKAKVENIEVQTTKHNGRMTKLETKTNELELADIDHANECPLWDKVGVLESKEKARSTIKSFLITVGSFMLGGATIGGIIFEILKHYNK